MTGNCKSCGGLVMQPGVHYGYAGAVCTCSWTEAKQPTDLRSDEPLVWMHGFHSRDDEVRKLQLDIGKLFIECEAMKAERDLLARVVLAYVSAGTQYTVTYEENNEAYELAAKIVWGE